MKKINKKKLPSPFLVFPFPLLATFSIFCSFLYEPKSRFGVSVWSRARLQVTGRCPNLLRSRAASWGEDPGKVSPRETVTPGAKPNTFPSWHSTQRPAGRPAALWLMSEKPWINQKNKSTPRKIQPSPSSSSQLGQHC